MKQFAGLLFLLVLACTEDGFSPAPAPLPPSPIPPPPEPLPLPTVQIVSGDGQVGTYGEYLAEPLVVRVNDTQGNGIPGVQVSWSIRSGFGEFANSEWTSITSADGSASIRFRPAWPSPATVTASVQQLLPANFAESAGGPVVALVRVWPLFDCDDNGPILMLGPSDLIPVGALVEWDVWCGGRLRSITVPPGGTSFDTLLQSHQRFTSRLDVAGDWTVQESIKSTTFRLRVR